MLEAHFGRGMGPFPVSCRVAMGSNADKDAWEGGVVGVAGCEAVTFEAESEPSGDCGGVASSKQMKTWVPEFLRGTGGCLRLDGVVAGSVAGSAWVTGSAWATNARMLNVHGETGGVDSEKSSSLTSASDYHPPDTNT